MSSPWDIDYFNPPTPNVRPPKSPQSPALIPEADRLYQVQRNALKALNRVRDIEIGLKEVNPNLRREIQQLERDIENTYRVIRSWLVKHT